MDYFLLIEKHFQCLQINPNIVGIKILVALNVLKHILFVFGTLGGFPQNKTAIFMPRKMAAFPINRCFLSDFHHKWKPVMGKVA